MDEKIKQILEDCNEFLQIPSTINYEFPFLNYINLKVKELGFKTILNKKYLVINPNKNSNLIFSCHIDRHGLIRNSKNQFEYAAYFYKKKYNLKFHKDYHDFYIQTALRHTNEKIISYDIKTGEKIGKYATIRYNLDWEKKLVTYDLDKEPSKNEKIFMFESKINISKDIFFGQIDNVISFATLFQFLKDKNFKNEIILTCEEEIGRSWIHVIKYLDTKKIIPKIITLDTTPYENFNNKKEAFLVLRKGDENGNFDLNLVKKLEKKLKKLNIPIYYKSSSIGMTELGRISSSSNQKYTGATIQIPSLNYHTTYETATIKSLESYYKIILELEKEF